MTIDLNSIASDDASTGIAWFGESVTHRPKDVSANDANVEAIVELDPVADGDTGHQLQRGTLTVASSVELDARDSWKIRGHWFGAGEAQPAEAGLAIIPIERRINRATTRR
jgi:hypothetical protein